MGFSVRKRRENAGLKIFPELQSIKQEERMEYAQRQMNLFETTIVNQDYVSDKRKRGCEVREFLLPCFTAPLVRALKHALVKKERRERRGKKEPCISRLYQGLSTTLIKPGSAACSRSNQALPWSSGTDALMRLSTSTILCAIRSRQISYSPEDAQLPYSEI